MAIWVSKDASGPLECRPMPLNNFLIGLTAENLEILTFKMFLCTFLKFPLYDVRAKNASNGKSKYSPCSVDKMVPFFHYPFFIFKKNLFSPMTRPIMVHTFSMHNFSSQHDLEVSNMSFEK